MPHSIPARRNWYHRCQITVYPTPKQVTLQFDVCVEKVNLNLCSFILAIVLGLGALAPMSATADEAELWARLKQGDLVVLLRHTETVAGIGAPPRLQAQRLRQPT